MANEEKKVEYLQFTTENGSASELFKIPHTWQDVGAAPGGYGLGSKSSLEIYDLNQCIQNGWYRINEKVQPEYYAGIFPYGAVHVIARSSSDIMQRIVNFGGAPYEMLRYTTNGGQTWFEEWVNPPMLLNKEYRTTERYKGKPVYVKVISFGKKLPNNGTVSTSWSPDSGSVEAVIDAKVITSSGAFIIERLSAGKNTIFITVPSNYSTYDAEVILKYTKTT